MDEGGMEKKKTIVAQEVDVSICLHHPLPYHGRRFWFSYFRFERKAGRTSVRSRIVVFDPPFAVIAASCSGMSSPVHAKLEGADARKFSRS